MQPLHAIKVSYIPATGTRGSRVKLVSERFEETVVIHYDYKFSSSADIAQDYLEKKGF